jgi:hypothetical protein
MGDCAVGVTLGGYALANLIGEERDSVSMSRYLNVPIWVDGRIWIPAYHPAYVLRNREQMTALVGSLKMALALRWGKRKLPVPPWDQIEVEGTKGIDFGPHLEKQGWAFLYSETLGTQIVILRDEMCLPPPSLIHLPTYTLDELVNVSLLGKGRRRGWTKRALRTLNMVKHEFDGVVIQG